MFRYIALFVGLALLPSASLGDKLAAPRPLSAAFHAAARSDWAMADLLASKAAPEAQVLMQWVKLRAGKGSAKRRWALCATTRIGLVLRGWHR